MEESWENLAGALPGLSLSERPAPSLVSVDTTAHAGEVTKPPTPPPAESASAQPQYQTQQQPQMPAAAQGYEAIDAAIRQALADPTQRITVIKCEELVEKFLADPCQETLQFPASFTSYQRMLAHRVGQYYGLQTSTVDYEESQGRVVGIRTMHCKDPKPRLRTMDVRSDLVAQRTGSVDGMGVPVSDKPRLLRRQDDERAQLSSSELSLNQSPSRTIKERHENYMKAREELGLGSGGPQDGMGMGRGGRGPPGGRFGGLGGRMEGGRGRKAVFRDKDKDLSDPDYRRGMNRFSATARFDPAFAPMPAGGIYQVPTYSTEFPSLRMAGGPGGPPGRPHMAPQQYPGDHSQGAAGPMQQHPMAAQHQPAGPAGPWGQQQPPHQGLGGVRPPPPPPPPHHHVGGPGGNGGSQGKGHPGGAAASGAPDRAGGSMGGRQQQSQHAAAYGQAVGAAAYPGMGAQYPVQVGMSAAGFMHGPAGQPVYGMAAGGAIPAGAMYAAAAPGMGGAFYPGVGMGMAVPAGAAYGYVAATPAPGMSIGMGSQGEAIALAPQGAYPVYSYPAGAAMYPAAATAAAQMSQQGQVHPAGMRPMYGVPAFYPPYDPAQYGSGSGGQGEGRSYGGYTHHHHSHHGGGQHGGMGAHGHGGGRGRDTEAEGARGEQQAQGGAAAGGSSGAEAQ